MTGEKPQALIPLRSNPAYPQLNKSLPRRLIVKYGANPEDIGLLITTPGSASLSLLEGKPGSSLEGLESALLAVLIGAMDLADSVRVVMDGEKMRVEVSNPRMESRNILLYQCLGSPVASIVASIIAEALGKPLFIDSEEYKKGKDIVELKVLQ